MNIHLLIIGLVSTYVLYYIFIKLLLKKFTLKEILVNVYIVSAILVFILFKDDLQTSLKKIDMHYILLIVLAGIIVLTDGLAIIGCNKKINFGAIDGMATAFYLTIVAVISAVFFNSVISISSFIGIVFVGIGALLIELK